VTCVYIYEYEPDTCPEGVYSLTTTYQWPAPAQPYHGHTIGELDLLGSKSAVLTKDDVKWMSMHFGPRDPGYGLWSMSPEDRKIKSGYESDIFAIRLAEKSAKENSLIAVNVSSYMFTRERLARKIFRGRHWLPFVNLFVVKMFDLTRYVENRRIFFLTNKRYENQRSNISLMEQSICGSDFYRIEIKKEKIRHFLRTGEICD
jgi:hypothetical protein